MKQLQIICKICDKNMFIMSYFCHHLHQCQWIHDTSMYFLYKNKFLSWILILSSSLDLIIGFLLFSYSALTIRIDWIVFGNQKMNEYEYQIPLFSTNYSNSRIVRIVRSNTGTDLPDAAPRFWMLSVKTGGRSKLKLLTFDICCR